MPPVGEVGKRLIGKDAFINQSPPRETGAPDGLSFLFLRTSIFWKSLDPAPGLFRKKKYHGKPQTHPFRTTVSAFHPVTNAALEANHLLIETYQLGNHEI